MPTVESQSLIDAVKQRAGNDSSVFLHFLQAFYQSSGPEHLRARQPDELLDLAGWHFQLARERAHSQVAVAVRVREKSRGRLFASVATVAPDMPFLVNTITMAVRAAGGHIDWMLHPVLRLVRDPAGELLSVRGPAELASHGDEESLIYIEFDLASEADLCRLENDLQRTLDDLRVVVDDWTAMAQRMQCVVDAIEPGQGDQDQSLADEVRAFLRWLMDDHFTFLAYRERREEGDENPFSDVPGSSLGLLREDRPDLDPESYIAPDSEIEKHVQSPRLLVVTKASTRSWIHHPEYMDVIAVKQLDSTGNVTSVHRFLGLFAVETYATSPRDIPVLRQKIIDVVARAQLRPHSHSAKALQYVLETFPQDELFQSSVDQLYDTAMGVVALRKLQRLRLFMRRDRYGRFFSCMVYLSRDRYSVELRQRIANELADMLGGTAKESHAQFLRDALVRVRYIIATAPGSEMELPAANIEQRLLDAARTWADAFHEALEQLEDHELAAHLRTAYVNAFPAAYRDQLPATEAVADACLFETIGPADMPVMRIQDNGGSDHELRMKFHGHGEAVALSQILPVLENFGLLVQSERPFELHPTCGQTLWVSELRAQYTQSGDVAAHAARLEEAFARTWHGQAENDGLNRLVTAAGLDWRRVALVRACTRYLLQTELPHSPAYVENMLAQHPQLVSRMVELFELRLQPDLQGDRHHRELQSVQQIHQALDAVTSLDADRILRNLLGVILAVLRTNYFQRDAQGAPKPHISLKLASEHIPELPEPRPATETFVYAPNAEGILLRAGKVARGGLRWSDRREDFRTEVLGLMKTQVVKNAVIVPTGAKGGFVLKPEVPDEDRQARQQRGIAGYQTLIRGLLDITDNREGDRIVTPPDVVCHDAEDPYLVVAADKGTASFSDIANTLAQEYRFWLADAFASGGEHGYDHKAMGITARGGWESVKRHFREMGRDTQSENFSVVGIGDMGGMYSATACCARLTSGCWLPSIICIFSLTRIPTRHPVSRNASVCSNNPGSAGMITTGLYCPTAAGFTRAATRSSRCHNRRVRHWGPSRKNSRPTN